MNAIIFISILGVLAMISEFIGLKKVIYPVIVLALVGIIGYNGYFFWNNPDMHYGMLLHDNYSIAFGSLLLVITLLWFLISRESYKAMEFNAGDHYALILFSTVGGLLLASFTNMTMLFLGIEILSIPLYILAGSKKNNIHSIESSIKYFILGSFATGIMLLGIAFIYGATGSFDFTEIANYAKTGSDTPLFYTGIVLLTISFAFKISAVPFHFWVPDVYTGAPTFITAFMSTFVKVAAFAGFYHLLDGLFDNVPDYLNILFIGISALTILAGNITAAYQTSAKRMLAYSGISQAGYMLMIFPILNSDKAISSLFVYLTGYAIANIPVFYVIYKMEQNNNGEASVDHFKGLGQSNPLLAFVTALSLISLAGIPPAAGFFGKFYLFTEVLKADNLCLVLIAIMGSLISVYYYFKIIISMYGEVPAGEPILAKPLAISSIVLVLISILIVLIGILPECLIHLGMNI